MILSHPFNETICFNVIKKKREKKGEKRNNPK